MKTIFIFVFFVPFCWANDNMNTSYFVENGIGKAFTCFGDFKNGVLPTGIWIDDVVNFHKGLLSINNFYTRVPSSPDYNPCYSYSGINEEKNYPIIWSFNRPLGSDEIIDCDENTLNVLFYNNSDCTGLPNSMHGNCYPPRTICNTGILNPPVQTKVGESFLLISDGPNYQVLAGNGSCIDHKITSSFDPSIHELHMFLATFNKSTLCYETEQAYTSFSNVLIKSDFSIKFFSNTICTLPAQTVFTTSLTTPPCANGWSFAGDKDIWYANAYPFD